MSAVVRSAQKLAVNVGARVGDMVNRLMPPEQRERALESLRAFSVRNPKLATFLAAQTALAGLPILLFLAFTIAVLFTSLVTCILLGVIVAIVFTLVVTGFALLFVVPIVIIGSCAASTCFFWGLVGYLVLRRINGGETPVQSGGTKLHDTLNELTGARVRDPVNQTCSNHQQERMAVATPQDEIIGLGSENGCGTDGTHCGSPRRRNLGQTNGAGHSGEAGEKGREDGTRGAQSTTRDTVQGTQHPPETHMTTYDPALSKVVDWKTEFQQEGIAA